MSIYNEIRDTLEYTLSQVAGLPSVAWENIAFNPTRTSSYVRPFLVPTRRIPAVRGLNPQIRYEGYFQVDCCSPANLGPQTADDLADSIIDAFEATTDLTYNSTTVSIRFTERDMGYIEETQHYCVPVRVFWYIYN